MYSPLRSRRLIPLALVMALGLMPALAHPDHHQPTQQGDRHGSSADQHQHNHEHH
jgi:hypothetical protein